MGEIEDRFTELIDWLISPTGFGQEVHADERWCEEGDPKNCSGRCFELGKMVRRHVIEMLLNGARVKYNHVLDELERM